MAGRFVPSQINTCYGGVKKAQTPRPLFASRGVCLERSKAAWLQALQLGGMAKSAQNEV